MYISLNWIQDLLEGDVNVFPQDIANWLSTKTVEVEGIIDRSKDFENIIVGKVTEHTKHPNADKLTINMVDIGQGTDVKIVCGAPNVTVGMFVAVALPGASVTWHGEGESVVLEATKIRGEESFGMICAADEIGLKDLFPATDGIADLTNTIDAKPGTSVAEALGLTDIVLDIDNKSMTHRPDLWGHYGMAREVGAIMNLNNQNSAIGLKTLNTDIQAGSGDAPKVKIKDKACRRYLSFTVDNVKIGPSPQWIQQRLMSIGQRPINNIVDLTNFVMLELGQPMHAFDLERLDSAEITVRMAKSGEKITTLDGAEHKLSKEDLLITSGNNPVALAGVMGSQGSEISDTTTSLLLEFANFDPATIRRSASRLGLRSDASARFEKSLDPALVTKAAARFMELLADIIPEAKVSSQIADEGVTGFSVGPIELSLKFITDRIGQDIPVEQIENLLSSIGFGVDVSGNNFSITIPSWRATKDISISEDIVEEIARLYGYDKIIARQPQITLQPAPVIQSRVQERKIRDLLVNVVKGTEIMTYPFIDPRWIQRFDEEPSGIKVLNPQDETQNLLRQTLLYSMLKVISKNASSKEQFRLFEIARIFRQRPGSFLSRPKGSQLPDEPRMLAIGIVGEVEPFFEVKGITEMLLSKLGYNVTFETMDTTADFSDNGRLQEVMVNDQKVGVIAAIDPKVLAKGKIRRTVGTLELNLDVLLNMESNDQKYKLLEKFPSIVQDISLELGSNITYAELEKYFKSCHNLVTTVELIDTFERGDVRSMAFRLIFQSEERTLTQAEVSEVMSDITNKLTDLFDVTIR